MLEGDLGRDATDMTTVRRNRDDDIRVCIDRPRPVGRIIASADRAIAERPTNAPLRPPRPGAAATEALRMAVDTACEWAPGRTLRVRFLDGHEAVKARVTEHALQWTEHANIRFDFGADPDAEIRVSFQGRGSWSELGTDALAVPGDEPTMNLGWLDRDTLDDELAQVVLHEFGHVLGCVHEHQSPSAAIAWDKPAVYRYYAGPPNSWTAAEVDQNLFARYSRGRTQFTRFDPTSIMVYPIPEEHTLGDFSVGFNTSLSSTDREFIRIVYPVEERPVIPVEIDGPPIDASIGEHREEDHFVLTVTRAGRFVVGTEGPTDVVLALFGPDSETHLVADDDDSGTNRNARVEAQLTPGRYLVRVRHHRPTGTGPYRLSARAEP